MIKRTKRIFSTITITLCVSIGLTLPTEVFASTKQKDEKVYSYFDGVQGETEEIGDIVVELLTKGQKLQKNFCLTTAQR